MPQYYEPQFECASRDEMRAVQSKRLAEMAERCYNNIPFYRRKFDEMGLKPGDIRSIDDLQKLPFTYKQDLRDNYPFGLFASGRDDLRRIHASSGTTGKQTVVGYTENDLDIWARSVARGLTSIGGKKSDYVHILSLIHILGNSFNDKLRNMGLAADDSQILRN